MLATSLLNSVLSCLGRERTGRQCFDLGSAIFLFLFYKNELLELQVCSDLESHCVMMRLYLIWTGISRSDLVVLEKHVVYSLTKEKTASCFYIMQCKSINQDIQIPVKEIFERLVLVFLTALA